jgi:hypothetical protein
MGRRVLGIELDGPLVAGDGLVAVARGFQRVAEIPANLGPGLESVRRPEIANGLGVVSLVELGETQAEAQPTALSPLLSPFSPSARGDLVEMRGSPLP